MSVHAHCLMYNNKREMASAAVRQVINTFKVAADVGAEAVSAYVISMATNASDVLAVELLKREACFVVRPALRCPQYPTLPADERG